MSLSFWTTSSASTFSRIASSPRRAFIIFWRPSKAKGMVTMPIVSMPISLATRATTGPAPVPVPPPIDAVTKAILVPSLNISRIRSNDFSASSRPLSGSPPAPKPSSPSCSLTGTGQFTSCWLSVLHTRNVTFSMPSSHIFLTALQPPPPTPTTLMIPMDWSLGMTKSMPASFVSSGLASTRAPRIPVFSYSFSIVSTPYYLTLKSP